MRTQAPKIRKRRKRRIFIYLIMDIKQVRIGNYINYNYLETSIVSVIESGEDITNASSNEYSPIPLTEEWILKFKYIKLNNSFFTTKGHLIWRINDLIMCDKNGIVLKYVHQLQNLYFALTGQELTIKQ